MRNTKLHISERYIFFCRFISARKVEASKAIAKGNFYLFTLLILIVRVSGKARKKNI